MGMVEVPHCGFYWAIQKPVTPDAGDDWRTVQTPDSLKLCGDSQIQGAVLEDPGMELGWGAAGSRVSEWAR